MKDNCSNVSRLLGKYFDQEATAQERSLVEKHLPTCSACGESLKSMEKLRDAIKIPIEDTVQKENLEWVWPKIQRGIEAYQKPSWWEALLSQVDLLSFLRRRVWIPAVAAILILIVAAFPFFLKKFSSPPGSSVVEYVESQDYNVMVYESEQGNVTVIWVLDGPEQEATRS